MNGSTPYYNRTRASASLPLALLPFRNADGRVDSIQVLRGGRPVQTILPDADADTPPFSGYDVDTVDVNFDGFPDVYHQVVWGATGNAAFTWWLFDSDSGRFVPSPEFSQAIGGFTLYPARREITVRSNGGHAGAIFEMDVYRPRGRTLTRVRAVHQDWDPDAERYLRTTGRLEGNRWTEKVDTFTVETLPPPDST